MVTCEAGTVTRISEGETEAPSEEVTYTDGRGSTEGRSSSFASNK